MKQEIIDFINWIFIPKNRVFVQKSSGQRIAKLYEEETGNKVSYTFVLYHRNKWVMINNQPFELEKLPMFILKTESFKKYAEENNISIETLDGPIWKDIDNDTQVEVLPQSNTNIIRGAVVDCSELILSPSVLTERSNKVAPDCSE